jgi:hypothetical protein
MLSGAGFPMHRDLDVVYCTTPIESAAIPYQHWCYARPTYQRTVVPIN